MNYQQWIVVAMFAIAFLFRAVTMSRDKDADTGVVVVGFALLMLWYGALVMLLHGGGFW